MRRTYIILLFLSFVSAQVHAGGIVTNGNQSASWIRMLCRDASTDVDAVFYNPAALTLLENGFYFQVNNQTIAQKREIVNDHPFLNNHSYKGDIFVPALPSAFLVYKKDKLALFGSFAVIGGGGSATYANGLPSFEVPIASIPKSLSASGIPTTSYSTDIYFSGTSAYYGFEVGGAYKINDWLSLALGFRYNSARNSYTGHLKNIAINPNYTAFGSQYNGSLVSASSFFADAQASLKRMSAAASQYATGLSALSSQGNGSQAISNVLPAADVLNVQTLVAASGGNPANITVDDAKNYLSKTSVAYFQAKSDYMGANSTATKDQEVDVKQMGHSFTPIFGANLRLLEGKLNVGLKYEGKSSMKVTNKVTKDATGMFPDGKEVGADIPALLSIGVKYAILPKFRAQVGYHYYFDRDCDYGRSAKDDAGVVHTGNSYLLSSNSYEAALGLEFDLNDNLALSLGYLYTSSSPTLAYQTDLSYTLNSHSIGFGGIYKLTPKFSIELGLMYTNYVNGSKNISYAGVPFAVKETYYKSNVVGSIGLTYNFGK